MGMKPNLVQGNPAAKRKNSPAPLAKQKRTNLVQTEVMAKKKNVPTPYAKNTEGQSLRITPTNVPPRDLPDDMRIHTELTTGKRSNSHNRSGR
jgi:hypothetical protein